MKSRFALAAIAAVAIAAPANAQIPAPVTTDLVEWDVSPLGDFTPGSLAVDDKSSKHSKVWFVTRAGETRLYRMSPGLDMKRQNASATSWDLGAQLTGGVRLRHSDDGRYAFVNVNKADPSLGALVAIDTKDNTRVTWEDRPFVPEMSDVSVDTRNGGTTVFTAAPFYDPADFPGSDGVVQRLRPSMPEFRNGRWVVPALVTRYPIGGGAGTCNDLPGSVGSPCIPGITVDRRRGHPIYVSEPQFVNADGSVGAIGEIDPRPVHCPGTSTPACVRVRHWPLPAGTGEPRQIRVDDLGRVWGITSTGHLFSLEIDRSCDRAKVTRHDPLGFDEYLFAVAPDGGLIGFTDTNNNKVSVLLPQRTPVPVTPAIAFIRPIERTIFGDRVPVTPATHVIEPANVEAMGVRYTTPNDGTYVETDVSTGIVRSNTSAPSMFPTGMEPDGKWKTGAFFYGVAFSDGTNRIGHLAVKVDRNEDVECRRGDHDVDHDGIDDENDDDMDGDGIPNFLDDDSDNDTVPDVIDDDKNDDAIEDTHQSPGHREDKRSDRGVMAAGETRDYEMTYTANSVSLLAIVEAAEVTAPLSIEILDDAGTVLSSTPAVLGKAVMTSTPALPGVYTVRVKNAGQSPVSYTTTLIGKQISF